MDMHNLTGAGVRFQNGASGIARIRAAVGKIQEPVRFIMGILPMRSDMADDD